MPNRSGEKVMAETTVQPQATVEEPDATEVAQPADEEQDGVEAELLVEDISIDGMCGVY
jgi:mycofactocin precursor